MHNPSAIGACMRHEIWGKTEQRPQAHEKPLQSGHFQICGSSPRLPCLFQLKPRPTSVFSAILQVQPPDEKNENKAPVVTQQDFTTVMTQLKAPLDEELTQRIIEVITWLVVLNLSTMVLVSDQGQRCMRITTTVSCRWGCRVRGWVRFISPISHSSLLHIAQPPHPQPNSFGPSVSMCLWVSGANHRWMRTQRIFMSLGVAAVFNPLKSGITAKAHLLPLHGFLGHPLW